MTHNFIKAYGLLFLGCVLNCKYTEYKVSKTGESRLKPLNPSKLQRSVLGISFTLMDPYIREETENLLYDESSFTGDVGGFLGLLLGMSLLDLYSMFVNAIGNLN